MKIIIVRHAQCYHNTQKRVSGLYTTLTPLGKKQAERLARRLLQENIDVIYSSDLIRCKQTIKPFLQLRKVPIYYIKGLRERNYGIFHGKPRFQLDKWLEKERHTNMFVKLPEGESVKEARARAALILGKIISKEKGKNVLIVTHGGFKVAILLNLFGENENEHYHKYKNENTAMTIIEIKDKGNHSIKLLNSIAHLEDI